MSERSETVMEISLNLIEDAVKLKNLNEVRKALIEYIRVEPGNSEKIVNVLNYAKAHIGGLFENHDGKVLEEEDKWDKEYFVKTLHDLSDNFSEERFNHLILVGAYLYPCVDEETEKDKIIINNVKPVTDAEIRFEKVKTYLALGCGIVAGFLVGKAFNKKK